MQASEESLSYKMTRADALDGSAARWHTERHRRILAQHPEVKRLFGVDPRSAAWVVGLCVAQLAIAVSLRERRVWVILVVAYVVGAMIAHALGVLVHECAHNLVFHATWKNKLLSIVANVGLGAPGALSFRHEHLLHHRHLGDAREPDGNDPQAPTRREVLAVGRSSAWKPLRFTLGRFVFPARRSSHPPKDPWLVLNVASCVVAMTALTLAFGWKPLAYVMLSLLFAFGPHAVGARRLSEHLTLRRGQPTNSYYGVLNHLAFDVGYHVEHHDFPYVPWRRLRRLHELAAPDYAALASVPSWSRLLLDHFFDERYSAAQYVGLSTDFVEEREHETASAMQPPLPGGR